MKKTLKALLFAVAVFTLLAFTVSALVPYEMGQYGQLNYTAYSAEGKPVTDGVISDNEYGSPVGVFNYGDTGTYWNGNEYDDATLKELIPKDVTLYMTYDNTNLYVGVSCIDTSHMTPLSGTGVWDGDYLEFDIKLFSEEFDYANRVRFALGADNSGDVTGYYAAIPDYAQPTYAVNDEIKDLNYCNVTVNGDLTVYEACLPWSEILGTSGAPDKALFYFQLGCSSEKLVDDSEYEAYLGVYRCATRLTDGQVAEVEAAGGTGTIAYPIITFAGKAPVAETEAEVVETPDEGSAEAPAADAPAAAQTADAGIIAVLASVISLAGYAITKKR